MSVSSSATSCHQSSPHHELGHCANCHLTAHNPTLSPIQASSLLPWDTGSQYYYSILSAYGEPQTSCSSYDACLLFYPPRYLTGHLTGRLAGLGARPDCGTHFTNQHLHRRGAAVSDKDIAYLITLMTLSLAWMKVRFVPFSSWEFRSCDFCNRYAHVIKQ
jgi:hypothetical protein